ncbi:MAG TPA: MBL fold metallo-hydrolase [Gammaproteobacteria bacterium]|nr:MBL fold metallo-hydrolase [Gammaproteobacteria bacterium]
MLQYQLIPVTSFQQNCSLVWCDQTNEAVLVDPGGEAERLLSAVAEHRLDLKAIWLTHGHLDHVGATAELKEKLNLPVTGPHKDDQFLLDAIPKQVERFGFAPVDSFLPEQWLDEGDTLKVGNEVLSILHTPGHTPGHVVLKHDKQKILWVGDVLFKHSVGRTDFPRGNHAELIASIKNKLLVLDDAWRFIPGHGPESTIGEERVHNPFLK